MRKYHIYIQHIKIISFNYWNETTTYKWLPWEYLGYVSGTKDLYTYFRNYVKLYNIFSIRSVKFHNSFEYDNRCFNKKYIDYRRRFLIVDDSGNIRSFDGLTKAYRKHKMRHYGHYAYQIRVGEMIQGTLVTREYDDGTSKSQIVSIGGQVYGF